MNKVEWEKYFLENSPPTDFEGALQMEKFCKIHREKNPIALVTSGGTVCPIEQKSRSTGKRGAASTEYLLLQGYAVIFLYEKNSCQPFLRHVDEQSLINMCQNHVGGILGLSKTNSEKLQPIYREYKIARSERRLLMVPYSTVFDYLWLLRAAITCLQEVALKAPSEKALLYSTSALSELYLPPGKMSEHEIQSSSGILNVQFESLPKMLQHHLMSVWGPDLFIVTFTLVADEKMLVDKARETLNKYNHDLVIGNLLKTRHEEVTFVIQKESELISLTEHQKLQNIEIEKLIVDEVVARHEKHTISYLTS